MGRDGMKVLIVEDDQDFAESLVIALAPIMVCVLGGMFAVVILSILLPLYDVLGGAGGAY